jgi:UDP-N-acetylglucosamine 2-epimerase (non-hydrolysing)
MKILHVVGARPNFMKAAPALAALATRGVRQILVHTGQHYDPRMSKMFFEQLDLPRPDYNLDVGSASHAVQTAKIMMRFEEVVEREKPNWVLVYGDVNSTIAASLVCAKLGIKVAHVEAGVRSFDRTMPEEINRLVTDALADLLLTPTEDGNRNLLREGVPWAKICLVGNLMIDTLVRLLPLAHLPDNLSIESPYVLVTLHRPANVDHPERLQRLMHALAELSQEVRVVFPVHPRTRKQMEELRLGPFPARLLLTEPLGYLEFLACQRDARLVITDSGGVQHETTYLGVPCITMRENTEWPVTVELGTNLLVGDNLSLFRQQAARALRGEWKSGQVPPLWDGKAGERVAEVVLNRA